LSVASILPVYRQQAREMEEPHPSVTSVETNLPRINYIEQVRDIRRNLEGKSHVQTIHHNPRDRSHFVDKDVVVRFTPRPDDAALKALLTSVDGHVKRDWGDRMIIRSNSLTTRQLMKAFAEHPDSLYAEPNYLLLPNKRPNDSLYRRYQWNLPLIGMEESWDISEGSKQVIVAVVDTGVDLDHP
jgi:thermitase